MPEKKPPLRMCSGCGLMVDKKALIRVVKSPEGELSIDMTGKKPGRGAYIHRDGECFKKARKARRFEKAFKGKIPDEIYNALETEITHA